MLKTELSFRVNMLEINLGRRLPQTGQVYPSSRTKSSQASTVLVGPPPPPSFLLTYSPTGSGPHHSKTWMSHPISPYMRNSSPAACYPSPSPRPARQSSTHFSATRSRTHYCTDTATQPTLSAVQSPTRA